MRLERLTVRWLAIESRDADAAPIDVILIVAQVADGAVGYGEAVLLPGVTAESPEQGWIVACKLAELSAGMAGADAVSLYARSHRGAPHVVSALTIAVEMAMGHPALRAVGELSLVATIGAHDMASIEEQVEDRLAEGHTQLRVVLPGGVEAGLGIVRRAVSAASGRARLRLDGNQVYCVEDAVALVRGIDGGAIDWIAQPCAAGDWEAAAAVRSASVVPLMIGGIFHSRQDIDLVIEVGAADFIGLRPSSAGGLSAFVELAAQVRASGLIPVLEDGPRSDLGLWTEARLACALGTGVRADISSTPATAERLVIAPVDSVDGMLRLTGMPRPALALDVIDTCTEESLSFPV